VKTSIANRIGPPNQIGARFRPHRVQHKAQAIPTNHSTAAARMEHLSTDVALHSRYPIGDGRGTNPGSSLLLRRATDTAKIAKLLEWIFGHRPPR
jgi:hypothetical protein